MNQGQFSSSHSRFTNRGRTDRVLLGALLALAVFLTLQLSQQQEPATARFIFQSPPADTPNPTAVQPDSPLATPPATSTSTPQPSETPTTIATSRPEATATSTSTETPQSTDTPLPTVTLVPAATATSPADTPLPPPAPTNTPPPATPTPLPAVTPTPPPGPPLPTPTPPGVLPPTPTPMPTPEPLSPELLPALPPSPTPTPTPLFLVAQPSPPPDIQPGERKLDLALLIDNLVIAVGYVWLCCGVLVLIAGAGFGAWLIYRKPRPGDQRARGGAERPAGGGLPPRPVTPPTGAQPPAGTRAQRPKRPRVTARHDR